jgi:ATPase subunit of ABC transporter with duplicated ATPase domains
MFHKDMVGQQVGLLSGGEKTRLAIALLMQRDYNLLVLDEPTTYLDVLSQSIILEALKAYAGTMLVVSHTADFILGLKPDKVLLLPEEKYTYWDNEYLVRVAEI